MKIRPIAFKFCSLYSDHEIVLTFIIKISKFSYQSIFMKNGKNSEELDGIVYTSGT